MLPYEIFETIKNLDYKEVGMAVNWNTIVDHDSKKVLLYFEESNGNLDWKVNFDFPVKVYKHQENKLSVHGGYVKAWKSANDTICNEVIDLLEKYKYNSIDVYGWSYGGAMAMVAAEDLNYRTGIKPTVITFGAPMPFYGKKTRDYVLSCCNEVKNYSHVNDIVPTVPPIGYYALNKVMLGAKDKRWYRLFNPNKWHCIYGDKDLY